MKKPSPPPSGFKIDRTPPIIGRQRDRSPKPTTDENPAKVKTEAVRQAQADTHQLRQPSSPWIDNLPASVEKDAPQAGPEANNLVIDGLASIIIEMQALGLSFDVPKSETLPQHFDLAPAIEKLLALVGRNNFYFRRRVPNSKEIKEALEAVLNSLDASDEVKVVAIRELYNERSSTLKQTELELTLPELPPALWKDRVDKRQSPPDFIKTTYRRWLSSGLLISQPYLSRVDEALYTALRRWLKTNKLPEGLDIPTKTQLLKRELASAGPQGVKDAYRLSQIAYRMR